MRRLIATLTSALPAVALLTTAAPAGADSIHVIDRDTEASPSFLDTVAVKFTNGRKKVTSQAAQSNFAFDSSYSIAALDVDVPGPAYYSVSISREIGEVTLTLFKGHGDEKTLRCPGAQIRVKDSDTSTGKNGWVRFEIPQRCLDNTKRVRFRYYIGQFSQGSEFGQDTTPGSTQGDLSWTRWVKRG